MHANAGRHVARTVLCAILLVTCVLAIPVPSSAAGYPRRIAIAPFASLTKEDIGGTVSVLPRLLASRLMALAGADVLLLPPGGKSPAEAAREAKYPLLLQGTVAKLGKGYSIDAAVTDLSTGGSAGAFFAAAATEDDIIAQLGLLSGEIAEKLFDVRGAIRAVSPAPAAAPAPAPVPAAPFAIGGAAGAAVSQAAPASPPPPAPVPTTLASGWLPSSLREVGQSVKIADEIYGVVTVGTDPEGNPLVAVYGRTNLYLYRVKGTEIAPFTRITKPLDHHFLSVAAMDIDGDGSREILVTDLVNETVASFVLKKKGDAYQEVADGIRYYLAVLPDWKGKPVLVGQYQGVDKPFEGKIMALRWDGKGFAEGEKFPQSTDILPLSAGLLGLSSARFGKEWRWVYTDASAYLRVLDAGGKSQYASTVQYGMTPDFFEWGPIVQIEGRRNWYRVRNPVRVAAGGGEDPLFLIPEVKVGVLNTLSSTRVVLLEWSRGQFREKAGSESSNRVVTGADFLSPDGFRKGGKIVASEIEQTGSAFSEKISRLVLYQAE
jgi:hypothetical protein